MFLRKHDIDFDDYDDKLMYSVNFNFESATENLLPHYFESIIGQETPNGNA